MEPKQLIAILAVAIIAGAACVGAAYAFNASLDNTDNSASVEYWMLSMKDSSNSAYNAQDGQAFKAAFTASTPYDTKTVYDPNAAETNYETLKMFWSGSTKVLGANLSPLGYVEVTAKDNTGSAIADLESNEHYFMTVSMLNDNEADKGTINSKYAFFAGVIVPETAAGKEHTIKTHATELIKLDETTVNVYFTKYEAKVPVQKLTSGVAIAVYAIPKALTDLASVSDDNLKRTGDADNIHKTDVLRGATVEFSLSSDKYTTAGELQADSLVVQVPDQTSEPAAKYRYVYDPSLPTDPSSWDLSNIVVTGVYKDTGTFDVGGVSTEKTVNTNRVLVVSTTTAYGSGVTSLALTAGEQTTTVGAEEITA